MASEGPNSAGTGADDATVGTKVWSNPTFIYVSDSNRADVRISDGPPSP